jgi:carboxyl-terminal processing protease
MAGALQETAGAKLIGEKTYGKGTVQVTFQEELGDGSNIKMTIMKWLTPNGRWIDKTGIEPDIQVEQPEYFRVAPMTKKTALKFDMVADDVRHMQVMLAGLGYDPGRKDGYFSEQTAQAVKSFQEQHGLPATGEADLATAQKIEEEITKKIRDPENDQQLKTAIQVVKQALAQQ